MNIQENTVMGMAKITNTVQVKLMTSLVSVLIIFTNSPVEVVWTAVEDNWKTFR